MPLLEKDIESRVVDHAKRLRYVVLKLNNPWSKGWPDRMFITPFGFVFFIEFKRPGQNPTLLQRRRCLTLRQHGCYAYVIDDIAEGKQVVDYHKDWSGMVAAPIPRESYPTDAFAGSGGGSFGPWTREDELFPGGDQDTEGEESD